MNAKNLPPFPLLIISVALHSSILLYVFILYFLSSQGGQLDWASGWRNFPEHRILLYVFCVLSGAMAVLAFSLPALVKSESGFSFNPLNQRTQQLTIARMALAESIAIFGFVLGFLNRAPLVAVPFAAVALFVQFLVGPIWGKLAKGPASPQ